MMFAPGRLVRHRDPGGATTSSSFSACRRDTRPARGELPQILTPRDFLAVLLDSVSGHDPTLTHVRPGCISISWCNFGPLDLMIWPNLQPHLRRDSFQARELGKVHSEPDDALANRSAHAHNTASNRLLAGHITVRWQGCALPCTSTHSAFFPSHPEGKAPWLRPAGAVTIAAPGFPRPLVSWFCYS